MKQKGVRLRAWFLALSALATALCSAAPTSAIVLDCAIQVELSYPQPDAVVSEFSGALLTFYGNISIVKPDPWVGLVTLSETNAPFPLTITPTEIAVGIGEFFTAAFVVNVSVPAAQLAHSSSDIYVVAAPQLGGGTCSIYGGFGRISVIPYYGAITGAAFPSVLTLGPDRPNATVAVNVTQATNDNRVSYQALVASGGVSGITFSAPRLVNLTASSPGHFATTFQVAIDDRLAVPGVYDVVVNVTANPRGTASPENHSAVEVVIRVVIERPQLLLQIAAVTTIGAAALVGVGMWTWKGMRRRDGDE